MPPAAVSGSASRRVRLDDAGVDWLSCSVPPGPQEAPFFELWRAIAEGLRQTGYDLRPKVWNGYEGYLCGHTYYGVRHDGAYLRLSSDAAHVWWRDAFRIAGRASRLDVQATIVNVRRGRDLAREARTLANRAPPLRGRPVEWQYLQTRNHGCTAYVGSRKSALFMRLYDKSAERKNGHLAGEWRYEIETKDERATSTAKALVAASDAATASAGIVWHAFNRRGVRPLFPKPKDAPEILAPRAETDDERRLRWLRENVSKTVARLRASGREAEVREALGLP